MKIMNVVTIIFLLIVLSSCVEKNKDICTYQTLSTTQENVISENEKINIPGGEIVDNTDLTTMTFNKDNTITLYFQLTLTDKIRNLLLKSNVFKSNYYVFAQIGDAPKINQEKFQPLKIDNNMKYDFLFHINIDDISDQTKIDNINKFEKKQVKYLTYSIYIYDYETNDLISTLITYCSKPIINNDNIQ